jgi:hypothetical protein
MIALELLEAELERLVRDHYADGQNTECDGCERANLIRLEMVALKTLVEDTDAD